MVELGLFVEERIELLDGWLVEMSPSNPPHAQAIRVLSRCLAEARQGVDLQVQLPLALSDHSEPEPDLALVPAGDYWGGHPTAAHLVIEVADASLRKDRGPKALAYALAGVPEYWVVNLVDRVVEVYTEPGAEGYGAVQRVAGDAVLSPGEFPEIQVPVARLFPAE